VSDPLEQLVLDLAERFNSLIDAQASAQDFELPEVDTAPEDLENLIPGISSVADGSAANSEFGGLPVVEVGFPMPRVPPPPATFTPPSPGESDLEPPSPPAFRAPTTPSIPEPGDLLAEVYEEPEGEASVEAADIEPGEPPEIGPESRTPPAEPTPFELPEGVLDVTEVPSRDLAAVIGQKFGSPSPPRIDVPLSPDRALKQTMAALRLRDQMMRTLLPDRIDMEETRALFEARRMQALARQIDDPSAYEPPVKWLLEQPIRYAKTTELWTRTATADYVKANPCNDYAASSVDTAAELTIYLPSMATLAYSPPNRSGDPNVLKGVVIAYGAAADGKLVCVSDYMDARARTIVIWSKNDGDDAEWPPGGWALCDGESHCRNCSGIFGGGATCAVCGEAYGVFTTHDLRGRFIVGWYDGGLPAADPRGDEGDYDVVNSTRHVYTHRHTAAAHTHTIPWGDVIAAGEDYAAVTTSEGDEYTDSMDHRPPWHAACFIERMPGKGQTGA